MTKSYLFISVNKKSQDFLGLGTFDMKGLFHNKPKLKRNLAECAARHERKQEPLSEVLGVLEAHTSDGADFLDDADLVIHPTGSIGSTDNINENAGSEIRKRGRTCRWTSITRSRIVGNFNVDKLMGHIIPLSEVMFEFLSSFRLGEGVLDFHYDYDYVEFF